MITESVLQIARNPIVILYVLIGVSVGIIFGAIPGLTATLAIVMFLPITYSMSSFEGIAMLIALYIGGISGGLIPAILLNIPGTPSSIATCFDGNPMAKKGEGAKALGVGVVFSFVGTLVGIAVLSFLTPLLSKTAIRFGAYEYCALTIMSFSMVISLTGEDALKGLVSVTLGAMLATVGLSPIDSVKRFTFGQFNLYSGFKLLVVLTGLFAVTEVLKYAEKKGSEKTIDNDSDLKIVGFGLSFREFCRQIPNAIRSALIGVGIGILPGIGGSISSLVSYTVSKNLSKEPDQYGTGIIDGVVASETANNATIGGAMVPLLSLGIPGDGTTAVLLGALMVHGISPGPLIFEKSGSIIFGLFIMMIIASAFMLIIELFGIRFFINILKIPGYFLYPLIMVFCCVGAIGDANRIFDCWGILIFGLLGYAFYKCDIPTVPFILGFILGPMLELNLRRVSMIASSDSIADHPIAILFLAVTVITVVLKCVIKHRRKANNER